MLGYFKATVAKPGVKGVLMRKNPEEVECNKPTERNLGFAKRRTRIPFWKVFFECTEVNGH